MSDLYERLAALPVSVDGYELEGHERDVSTGFLRKTTDIRMRGGGEEGLGEDVTYEARDHEVLQAAGPVLELAGDRTLGELFDRIGELDLFPEPPDRDVYRRYRRWGFESAALDLALRQNGTSLAEQAGLPPRPLRFVVSMRLGEPPSLEPVTARLEARPGLGFKLDATPSWDEALLAELAATDSVASIDLKGRYTGTAVDSPADAALYRRIIAALPEALLEDPHDDPAIEAVLDEGHWDRVTWDAPIHTVGDIEALPHKPREVNLKPSRMGSLRELLDAYEHCERHGIGVYGGGQFELSVGRGQIQALASLFHPDGANDVAPGGYDTLPLDPSLPASPVEPRLEPTGFRWAS
jgi:L-alanine-DL-glutamate epimerase-like enolase superfamily enzyme